MPATKTHQHAPPTKTECAYLNGWIETTTTTTATNGLIRKNLTPMVNIAGNAEEEKDFHLADDYVCLLVGCLTSQQHASVSQGRICSDNCTCCHTEIETADQTFYLTQSQHTDTGPTSPSTDPITPGAWQSRH